MGVTKSTAYLMTTKIGHEYRTVKVVDRLNSLENIFRPMNLTSCHHLSIDEYSKLEGLVAVCEKSGVHTKFAPDYNNIIPTKPYTEDLDGIPCHTCTPCSVKFIIQYSFETCSRHIRCYCCTHSFAIPMIITAIIVKVTSPGPLIFKQSVSDFTTGNLICTSSRLNESAERKAKKRKHGPPRMTLELLSIGKFMRKTNIDELPQIFNVLKGDMVYLSGPRPERPYFVNKFKEEIPRYMIKHQVRPGMTGWAQVNGFRG